MKQITLDIEKIVVLEGRNSTDTIWLHVKNLPQSCWPFSEDMMITLNAAHQTGVEYVRKNFGMEPEVISLPKNDLKFSKPNTDDYMDCHRTPMNDLDTK